MLQFQRLMDALSVFQHLELKEKGEKRAMLRPLHPNFRKEIEVCAGVVLRAAFALLGDKKGGYLCVAEPDQGLPQLMVLIGEIREYEALKACAWAPESCQRLARNRAHRTSFESRDPAKGMFGGAVRGKTRIFSFSGMPETMNEAAMLMLATYVEDMTREDAAQIAARNGNVFFQQLHGALLPVPEKPL